MKDLLLENGQLLVLATEFANLVYLLFIFIVVVVKIYRTCQPGDTFSNVLLLKKCSRYKRHKVRATPLPEFAAFESGVQCL